MKPSGMHPGLKLAVATALALASGAATALGLGTIEVKSGLDQPLVAEIPVIAGDRSELQRLSARLASPETFARVGLEAPQGPVSDLRFAVALDDAGNPVIRVTTAQPVDEPLLTFLVEVDWGRGRLVREYSALLDAPRTVSAPVQPPIQAPAVAPPNTIERPPQPRVAAEPAPAEPDPEPVATARQPAPAPDPAPAARARQASAPPVGAAPAPAPAAPPRAVTDEYAVRSGDTLSQIVGSLDIGRPSINQAMVALLRANPGAFIDGNINLLKAGAVLRVPDAAAVSAVEAAEAMALVRSQVRQWREASVAVPQPVAAEGSAASDQDGATADAGTGPGAADARLEIVPPGDGGAGGATQSGISAGGEGEMLRQELEQTRESLAARDAELAEMQDRLAELEKLQQQQHELLSFKDSELAAAQQRLAQGNGADTVEATAQAAASQLPWVFAGLGLLLAVAVGWLWNRRRTRTPAAPAFRAIHEPASTSNASTLAEGFPAAVAARTHDDAPAAAAAAPAGPDPAPVASTDAPQSRDPAQTPLWTAAEVAPVAAAPTWHQGGVDTSVAKPASGGTATAAADDDSGQDARADADEAGGHAPDGADDDRQQDDSDGDGTSEQERIELARAFIDLGDRDSARQLLGEIEAEGEPAARRQAARILREID